MKNGECPKLVAVCETKVHFLEIPEVVPMDEFKVKADMEALRDVDALLEEYADDYLEMSAEDFVSRLLDAFSELGFTLSEEQVRFFLEQYSADETPISAVRIHLVSEEAEI